MPRSHGESDFASNEEFLYREPILHAAAGGDADAVYYAAPVDLMRVFRRRGATLVDEQRAAAARMGRPVSAGRVSRLDGHGLARDGRAVVFSFSRTYRGWTNHSVQLEDGHVAAAALEMQGYFAD